MQIKIWNGNPCIYFGKIWLNWISLYYIDNFQVHWQNCLACLIKTKKVDVTQRIQEKPRSRFFSISDICHSTICWLENNNYLEWIMFIYLAENRQSQLYLWWKKHMFWSNVEEQINVSNHKAFKYNTMNIYIFLILIYWLHSCIIHLLSVKIGWKTF